jgi:hypothetical protein
MTISIVQSRLDGYDCKTAVEEENAIREISQEIVLSALSRAGFFNRAAFQGGTCLRILYGMERFSEDLDFSLSAPDDSFNLNTYLDTARMELKQYGFDFSTGGKNNKKNTVKKEFFKDGTIVKLLVFKYLKPGKDTRKISIKIEVDSNPPAGAGFEVKYLDYPFAFEARLLDMPSLFAGKSHALLCREYVKGRDWYDFSWYISRKTRINYEMLSSAINQQGPWKDKKVIADKNWYVENMRKKVSDIDWKKAAEDVRRFLKPHELPSLDLWGKDFFDSRIDKMEQYML